MITVACIAALAAFSAPHRPGVFLDSAGVIRWKDDSAEVALFGANYVVTTASDYRAAGYVHGDRKRMIDEDMAQFARMGWDGIRLTFWGDWEASDSAGNLVANDHLDLLDYLIAKARERGIYMLFSPIQLYGSNWPDALQDTTQPGFGRHFGKGRMGTDSAAIAAQVNYLHQVLNHVNPYTHVAIKDEPNILFIELVNEPWHHPEDMDGSVRYLNTLTDAVRSTGCDKLVFYNISQDFRIGDAILRSKVQGLTFGWYPSSLNSGHELQGNYLRGVDAYPDMLRPELARLPRIVYEFDSPDLRTGTMYPAMARTFRSVGTQFAAMFAYDMLRTASRNLGWQTHYLNLVYTPRKAMSAIIAAEAMRRLPRLRSYGAYPANTTFGDFHLSADSNVAVLAARDAYMNAGASSTPPVDPAALTRVAGYQSSPLVAYEGEGLYFLDKVRSGVWRLEVYPDAVPVRDPFEAPNAEKIVTRAISRAWPMTVTLPDLGESFSVQQIAGAVATAGHAVDGRITVTPGVYVLSASGPVSRTSLPATVGHLGIAEYHDAPRDTVPLAIASLLPPEVVAGRPATVRFRIVDTTDPDSATVFVRPGAGGFFRPFALHHDRPYAWSASMPGDAWREGPAEVVVTVYRGGHARTLPSDVAARPWDWNYYGSATWHVDVVDSTTPLVLLDPAADAGRLAFTRIGDAGRRGLFSVGLSPSGSEVLHLELPFYQGGGPVPDYTASLVVQDRVRARGETIGAADSIRVRLRGLVPGQVMHLSLMEDDGTTWGVMITADTAWHDMSLPLSAFTPTRGVLLPEGFPGEWNYWVGAAQGRGGAGDRLRPGHIERVLLSLRPEPGLQPAVHGGIELEWVRLEFRSSAVNGS